MFHTNKLNKIGILYDEQNTFLNTKQWKILQTK
jgi:hypothetical protein